LDSVGRLARELNRTTAQPDEASPLYLPFCVGENSIQSDEDAQSEEITRAFLGAFTGLNLVGTIAADAASALSSEDLARLVMSAKESRNLDEAREEWKMSAG